MGHALYIVKDLDHGPNTLPGMGRCLTMAWTTAHAQDFVKALYQDVVESHGSIFGVPRGPGPQPRHAAWARTTLVTSSRTRRMAPTRSLKWTTAHALDVVEVLYRSPGRHPGLVRVPDVVESHGNTYGVPRGPGPQP